MEITIKGSPKEIAELVSKLQAQQTVNRFTSVDFDQVVDHVAASTRSTAQLAADGKYEELFE